MLDRISRRIKRMAPLVGKDRRRFRRDFLQNLAACDWEPHSKYSVFTQYDQEFYLDNEQAFRHKYRCFYAVSKTIAPHKIIELGTSAGSSADAYLSAAEGAEYVGIDLFHVTPRHDDGSLWDPYEIAETLFTSRGFDNYRLIRADLRTLDALPAEADMVVVDGAHDFDNEYEDLRLALTASPNFIFIDDAADPENAEPAINKFLHENLRGRVEFTLPIDYVGGGLVIKLKR